MSQDRATSASTSECEVMASVENDSDGDQLIIAELCRDDAYLSMSVDAAVDVDAWR